MTKSKLSDLNDHLFAQLERLGTEDLTVEQIEADAAHRCNAGGADMTNRPSRSPMCWICAILAVFIVVGAGVATHAILTLFVIAAKAIWGLT